MLLFVQVRTPSVQSPWLWTCWIVSTLVHQVQVLLQMEGILILPSFLPSQESSSVSAQPHFYRRGACLTADATSTSLACFAFQGSSFTFPSHNPLHLTLKPLLEQEPIFTPVTPGMYTQLKKQPHTPFPDAGPGLLHKPFLPCGATGAPPGWGLSAPCPKL